MKGFKLMKINRDELSLLIREEIGGALNDYFKEFEIEDNEVESVVEATVDKVEEQIETVPEKPKTKTIEKTKNLNKKVSLSDLPPTAQRKINALLLNKKKKG